MSLLLKALASAEKDKKDKILTLQTATQEAQPELRLITEVDHHVAGLDKALPPQKSRYSGKPLVVSQQPSASAAPAHKTPKQQEAANVFSAAQLPKSHFAQVLWGLASISAGLMVWLGIELMSDDANTTQLLVSQNALPTAPSNAISIIEPTNALPENVLTRPNDNKKNSPEIKVTNLVAADSDAQLPASSNSEQSAPIPVAKTASTNTLLLQAAATSVSQSPEKQADITQPPLQLSTKKSSLSVDPLLLAAYDALNRGELSQAQQSYRQVLQKEVKSIDALLGMATIAQQQSRFSDAFGWYQKVLEIEPKNHIATAGILALQPSADGTSSQQVSQLKSLIAQQPEAASLHAALGNSYAEKNAWAQAQAAYFEASRFAPNNPDYIFNLAVSLEHLNKANLALIQYQRALLLVEQTGAAQPNAQLIQSRIQALQQP